jgi:hypothetical protein
MLGFLKDPWLVAAAVGLFCLILDLLASLDGDTPRAVLTKLFANFPLVYIPVAGGLLSEGQSNSEYQRLGFLCVLIELVCLFLYRRYTTKMTPTPSLVFAAVLCLVATAVFFVLWGYKPKDSTIAILAPTSTVGSHELIKIRTEPPLASDDTVFVFVRTGDQRWWRCLQSPTRSLTSPAEWSVDCPFGRPQDNVPSGAPFKVGVLHNRGDMDANGFLDSTWDMFKEPKAVQPVTRK